MRILELEITEIRGVRSLTLWPEGKNLVVYGRNGTGKSGVVDAIDFLLTGSMSRLHGSGTGGISLSHHGPHIDSADDSARIRAVVQLSVGAEPVQIARSLSNPSMIECEEDVRPQVEASLDVAQRGQHLLTRRDLLRFIASGSATRAQGIQDLLNLASVEGTRRSLVTVKNQISTQKGAAEAALSRANQSLSTVTGIASLSSDVLLEFVNDRRAVLDGQPLQELGAGDLKAGIHPLAVSESPVANTRVALRAIESLEAALDEDRCELLKGWDSGLREILAQFRADTALRLEAARERLSKLGLSLLDDSGSCPLCDAEWPPDELRNRLTDRLAAAAQGSSLNTTAEGHASKLSDRLSGMSANVSIVIEQLDLLGIDAGEADLEGWKERLDEHGKSLNDLNTYLDECCRTSEVAAGLASSGTLGVLADFKTRIAEAGATVSDEQQAWDVLTRTQDALAACTGAETRFCMEARALEHAVQLHDAFCSARDDTLDELYRSIEDRFVDLYRKLHAHESSFDAELRPSGAGLELNVEFFGRGRFPPHALHSEGHQDSMGVCLFLALTERLTAGAVDLVMLDDVMMSVDSDHRRALAKLLAEEFPSRQLLITTHDRVWANQLRTERVVVARNQYHFTDWSVESGPQLVGSEGLWQEIDRAMDSDDVPTAAQHLRRESEAFFSDICDGLQARTRHRLDSRVELGDLIGPATTTFRKLVKDGKRAAQSWDNNEVLDRLVELDTKAAEVIGRSQIEQWAVNDNVHYNEWANFAPEDFRPVVEAFRDLFDLFLCSKCETPMRLASTGTAPSRVVCNCDRSAWNLNAR